MHIAKQKEARMERLKPMVPTMQHSGKDSKKKKPAMVRGLRGWRKDRINKWSTGDLSETILYDTALVDIIAETKSLTPRV